MCPWGIFRDGKEKVISPSLSNVQDLVPRGLGLQALGNHDSLKN